MDINYAFLIRAYGRDYFEKEVGEVFRKFRTEQNVLQKDLCKMLEKPTGTISFWEKEGKCKKVDIESSLKIFNRSENDFYTELYTRLKKEYGYRTFLEKGKLTSLISLIREYGEKNVTQLSGEALRRCRSSADLTLKEAVRELNECLNREETELSAISQSQLYAWEKRGAFKVEYLPYILQVYQTKQKDFLDLLLFLLKTSDYVEECDENKPFSLSKDHEELWRYDGEPIRFVFYDGHSLPGIIAMKDDCIVFPSDVRVSFDRMRVGKIYFDPLQCSNACRKEIIDKILSYNEVREYIREKRSFWVEFLSPDRESTSCNPYKYNGYASFKSAEEQSDPEDECFYIGDRICFFNELNERFLAFKTELSDIVYEHHLIDPRRNVLKPSHRRHDNLSDLLNKQMKKENKEDFYNKFSEYIGVTNAQSSNIIEKWLDVDNLDYQQRVILADYFKIAPDLPNEDDPNEVEFYNLHEKYAYFIPFHCRPIWIMPKHGPARWGIVDVYKFQILFSDRGIPFSDIELHTDYDLPSVKETVNDFGRFDDFGSSYVDYSLSCVMKEYPSIFAYGFTPNDAIYNLEDMKAAETGEVSNKKVEVVVAYRFDEKPLLRKINGMQHAKFDLSDFSLWMDSRDNHELKIRNVSQMTYLRDYVCYKSLLSKESLKEKLIYIRDDRR